jgi:hypothetical protein
MLEQDVQREILAYLKGRGILCWKVPVGAMKVGGARAQSPLKGHPDIAMVLPGGRYGGLEVKRPDEPAKLSADQREWQARLEAAGALCAVVHSVAEVEALLRFDELLKGA